MREPVTLETLAERMEYLATQNKGDLESNHREADDLLLEALQLMVRTYGQQEAVERLRRAYAAVDKWYA